MAEGLLRRAAAERGVPLTVASAGIAAWDGAPPAEHAVTVMRERGIEIGGHGARTVTFDLLREFDLVLTMTRSHAESLLRRFPEAGDKIHVLSAYAEQPAADIPDPFGGPLETYRETADSLERLLDLVLEKLTGQSRG